jgi:hypothetical protein
MVKQGMAAKIFNYFIDFKSRLCRASQGFSRGSLNLDPIRLAARQ